MDKDQIRKTLEDRKQELQELAESRTETTSLDESQQDSTGRLADYDQHPGEIATDTAERTKDLAITGEIEDHIREIDYALERLDDDRYGVCEVDGEKISEERLRALPATRYCIDHAQENADQSE